MSKHFITTKSSFCLIAAYFVCTAAIGQDLKLTSKNGYTQERALALFPRFDKATWNLDDDYVSKLKRQKPSGKKNEYTSVNTFVVSWIAEEVTNKPYAQLVSERLWQKMGAESDGTIIVSPAGAAGSHGNICSTLRDVGRYGLLFTPSWNQVASQKVIPDALIKRMQTEGRPEIYNSGILAKKINGYLGEQVAFETRQWDFVLEDGDFGKSGYHGQTLYISPSKDLVVVSFATGKGYDTWSFARAIRKSLK